MTSAGFPATASGQNHPRGGKATEVWGHGNKGTEGLKQQLPETSLPEPQLLHSHRGTQGPLALSLTHPPFLPSASHADRAKSQKPYFQLLRGQGWSGWP